MSFRYLLGGVAAAALVAPLAYEAQAQQTAANLRGSVSDESGAAVAGAQITIIDTRNNAAAQATTTVSGNFFQTNLRVGGPYQITVTADGFEPLQVERPVLSIGTNVPLDVTLQPLGATEVIVVTARAQDSIIDIANGVGTVFTAEDIDDTPILNRDLTDVLELDPLVSIASRDELGTISFGGIEPRLNGFFVDGAVIADKFKLEEAFYPTLRQPISIDVLEAVAATFSEYSVLTKGAQGGVVNTVTKSGGNEFDGVVFYRFGDDGLTGEYPFGSKEDFGTFEEEEFGFTVSGPIIKDRLFFLVNYEEFESSQPVVEGDLTDADLAIFNDIRDVFLTATDDEGNLRYDGFDPGVKQRTVIDEQTSERLFLKLDAQITDTQRASFWYTAIEESRLQNTNGLTFKFPTAFYDKTTDIEVFYAQLVSDWTPTLSTTLRAVYQTNEVGQNARGDTSATGTQNPTFVIENTGLGDDVEAGPDPFRQANAFNDEQLQLFASANLVVPDFYGDHLFTFGGEFLSYELENLFGQFCRGEYTFASLDALAAGDAEVSYQNTPTNQCGDRVADWGYDKLDLFIQDEWQINADLTVNFGILYERYIGSDDVPEQNGFAESYGANSALDSLEGLDIIQPRFGFNWKAPLDVTVQGGFGLFSGGDPAVWFSNAFSPLPTLAFGDVENYSDFRNAPADLQELVEADTGPFNYDHIDPDFEIPSLWKASLGVDRLFDLGPLGDDWLLGAQIAYSQVNETYFFRNRAQLADQIVDEELAAQVAANTGVAPDGRPIYPDARTTGDAIQLTNSSEGESLSISFAASKEFDNGWSVYGSYTYTDSERLLPGSSSRHISNYRSLVTTDRNSGGPEGTSVFEVEDRFVFQTKYEREFFTNLETQVVLKAIFESGPVSNAGYVQSSPNRIFGRAAGGSPFSGVDQLYIPVLNADGDGFNDPRVVFAPGAEQAVFAELDRLDLLGDAGGISEKNSLRGPWTQRFDLGFSQELPGIPGLQRYVGDNQLKLTVDIFNVANLLNDDWGTQYDDPRFDSLSPIRPQLALAGDAALIEAGETSVVDPMTGDERSLFINPSAAGATCKVATDCVYVYGTGFGGDPFQRDLENSVYQIRIGLRYEF